MDQAVCLLGVYVKNEEPLLQNLNRWERRTELQDEPTVR
jgi:hypothetical protein